MVQVVSAMFLTLLWNDLRTACLDYKIFTKSNLNWDTIMYKKTISGNTVETAV
jgi:hypothetical protein